MQIRNIKTLPMDTKLSKGDKVLVVSGETNKASLIDAEQFRGEAGRSLENIEFLARSGDIQTFKFVFDDGTHFLYDVELPKLIVTNKNGNTATPNNSNGTNTNVTIENVQGLTEKIQEITNFIAGKANATHTHTINEVTGLQDELDKKATIELITQKIAEAQLNGGSSVDLSTYVTKQVLEEKLGQKSNATHMHIVSDVSGLQEILDTKITEERLDEKINQAKLDGSSADLSNYVTKSLLSSELVNKASVGHFHDIHDITGLEEILNKKINTDEVNNRLANISIDNVSGLLDFLTSITERQNELADKEHTHEISEINSLQDELDKKANATHTHTINEITDLSGELLRYAKSGESIGGQIIFEKKTKSEYESLQTKDPNTLYLITE